MIGYSDLTWREGKLYHGKKDTSVSLIKDKEHDFMYWLEWNFTEPLKSINPYNLENAKDNGKKLYLGYINESTENGT